MFVSGYLESLLAIIKAITGQDEPAISRREREVGAG